MHKYKVLEKHTAKTVGSGALCVLSTPSLIAFMENAAWSLAEASLPEGSTTVGISIEMKHIKASAVDEEIEVIATHVASEGRKMTFSIEAKDSHGDVVGTAIHERCIVDIQKFMSKIKKPCE